MLIVLFDVALNGAGEVVAFFERASADGLLRNQPEPGLHLINL